MSVCVGTENAEDEVIRLKTVFLLERKLIFVCVSVLPLLKLLKIILLCTKACYSVHHEIDIIAFCE